VLHTTKQPDLASVLILHRAPSSARIAFNAKFVNGGSDIVYRLSSGAYLTLSLVKNRATHSGWQSMKTKLEENFERYAILFLALIAVSVTSFFALRRYSIIARFGKSKKGKNGYTDTSSAPLVQYNPAKGHVTFYLNPSGPNFSLFHAKFQAKSHAIRLIFGPKGYHSFSQGEGFMFTDQHYGASYKIDRIESDGVVMFVEASTEEHRISGHMKSLPGADQFTTSCPH
jgi:hypothetical protein